MVKQTSQPNHLQKKKKSRKQRQQEITKAKLTYLRQQKAQTRHQLTVAQHSTKSMGKFDKKAHKAQKHQKPRRQKQVPQFKDCEQEKKRNLQILSRVLNEQKQKRVSHVL